MPLIQYGHNSSLQRVSIHIMESRENSLMAQFLFLRNGDALQLFGAASIFDQIKEFGPLLLLLISTIYHDHVPAMVLPTLWPIGA